MKQMLLAIAIMVPLSVGFERPADESIVVQVSLASGTKLQGEILVVRDSAIVLATRSGLSTNDLANNATPMMVIAERDIVSIRTVGSAHTLVGMVIGGVGGILIGSLIGNAIPVEQSPNDTFGCAAAIEKGNNATTGGIVGGLSGCLIGGLIGSGSYSEVETYITPEHRDFSFVRSLARYQVEPEFIKRLAR